MSFIVYFFSCLENIYCFVQCLGLLVVCILLNECEYLWVDEFYIFIVFSYGGGGIVGVVLCQVICFLNDVYNCQLICGVIVVGNCNFGDGWGCVGDVIV